MAKIIWTEPALDDLDAIARYIALDKPHAAKRIVQELFVRVEQLALFPQSGGKPRELSGTPYRQLVVPPLKIFYRVTPETVYVIYVSRQERRFKLQSIASREK